MRAGHAAPATPARAAPGPLAPAGPGPGPGLIGEPHGPDLRLLVPAATVWATAALVLRGEGAVRAGIVCAVLAVVAAGVLGTRRWRGPGRGRGRAPALVLLAAAVAGLAGAGAAGARLAALSTGPLPSLVAERATVEVIGVVVADPRRRDEPRGSTVRVRLRLEEVVAPGRGSATPVAVRHPVELRTGLLGWDRLLPGDRVATAGRLRPFPYGPLPVGVLDVDDPPTRLDRPSALSRVAGGLREGLQEASAAHLPGDAAGLLPGLVDGDTSRLADPVAQDFRAAGLSHLTAVSGSNVAVVVAAAVGLARTAGAGRGTTAAVALLAMAAFVVLVRPDPSVLRAGVMGGLGVLAVAAGQVRAAWSALGAAVLVLVLVDPFLAVAPGFALSVCATTGLALGPALRRWLLARRVPVLLADGLALALAAQAAVTPLLLVLDLPAGPVAVPANVAAGPVVPLVTLVGLAAVLVAPLSPALAGLVAATTAPALAWLLLVARAAADATPRDLVGGLLLGVAVVLLLLERRHRRARSPA